MRKLVPWCCVAWAAACSAEPTAHENGQNDGVTDFCGPQTDRPTNFPRNTLFRQYETVAFQDRNVRREVVPVERFSGRTADTSFTNRMQTLWNDSTGSYWQPGVGDIDGDNLDDVVGMKADEFDFTYVSRNRTGSLRYSGRTFRVTDLGDAFYTFVRVVDGRLRSLANRKILVVVHQNWDVSLVETRFNDSNQVEVVSFRRYRAQNAPMDPPRMRGVAGDLYNDGQLRVAILPQNGRVEPGNTAQIGTFSDANVSYQPVTFAPPQAPRVHLSNIYDVTLRKSLSYGMDGQPRLDADGNFIWAIELVAVGKFSCPTPQLGTHGVHTYRLFQNGGRPTFEFLQTGGLGLLSYHMTTSGADRAIPSEDTIAVGASARAQPVTDFALLSSRLYMRIGDKKVYMYENYSGLTVPIAWNYSFPGGYRSSSGYFQWIQAGDVSGYTEQMQYHTGPDLTLGSDKPIAVVMYPPFWRTRQSLPSGSLNRTYTNSMSQQRETTFNARAAMGIHGRVGGGGGVGVADVHVSVSADMEVSVNSFISQFQTMDYTFTQSDTAHIDEHIKPIVITEQTCVYNLIYKLKRGQVNALVRADTRRVIGGNEFVLVTIPKKYVDQGGRVINRPVISIVVRALANYNQDMATAGRPHMMIPEPHVAGVPWTSFFSAAGSERYYNLAGDEIANPGDNVITATRWIRAPEGAGGDSVNVDVTTGLSTGRNVGVGLDVTTSTRVDTSVRGGIPFIADAEVGAGVSFSVGAGVTTSTGTTFGSHTGLGFTAGLGAIPEGVDATRFRYQMKPYLYTWELPKPNNNPEGFPDAYPGGPTKVLVFDALFQGLGGVSWPERVPERALRVRDRFCEPTPNQPEEGYPDRLLEVVRVVGRGAVWRVVEDCSTKTDMGQDWVCDDPKDGAASCVPNTPGAPRRNTNTPSAPENAATSASETVSQ